MPRVAHNRLTLEQFLERAHEKHGNKFDYSQVTYQSGKDKVLIGCPIHGLIQQSPSNHLLGYGCQRCGLKHTAQKKTYDKAKFIAKAEATHGQHYDYSQTIYAGSKHKIAIVCPQHGLFEQLPAAHVGGHGCPQCGRERVVASGTYSQDSFIKLAHQVHANRYDYSQVVYVAAKQKVLIICPQHGLFEQQATNHLMGQGCRHCATERGAQIRARNTGQFITMAQAAHGQRYNYSQTIYVRGKAKVKIICPVHGLFEQAASDHVLGHGCRACAWDAMNELNRLTWIERAANRSCTLYFLRLYTGSESFYKVGITYQSVAQRYRELHKFGYSYEILAKHTSADAARIYDWEHSILKTFAHLRYRPKNRFGGETECFSSANEILAVFPL